MTMDAFGVERSDIAKFREIGTPPIGEVGYGIGGDNLRQARGRRNHITSMGDHRAEAREAARGFRGSFMGRVMAEQPNFKAKDRHRVRAQARQAGWYAEADSAHPRAFKAGTHAGAGAVNVLRAGKNPYYLIGGLALAGAGGAAAKDRHDAKKRLEERRRKAADARRKAAEVNKAMPGWALRAGAKLDARASRLTGAQGAAIGAGLGVGILAGTNEASRRIGNRMYGADVGVKEQYRHPIKTAHKQRAAEWDHYSRKAVQRGDRFDARSRANADSTKGEYAAIRAERQRAFARDATKVADFHRRAREVGQKQAEREYRASIGKADRRMKPETAQWSGRLPKHSEGAAVLRNAIDRAKQTPNTPPGARPGLRIVQLAKAKRLPGDNQQAEAARGRRTAGLTGAGIGYLAASRTGDVAPGVADLITRGGKNPTKARGKLVDARAARMKRVGGKTGAVLVGAGLLAAGEGAISDLHHRDSFRRARLQAAGKLQESLIGKSAFEVELAKAFDSERSRHSRNAAYTGVLAGGAVVSGAAGAKGIREGRKLRVVSRNEASLAGMGHMATQKTMADMLAGPKARTSAKGVREAQALHQEALGRAESASTLGRKGRALTRAGRGGLLGAAALGAAAAGVHTNDRRRGGRSYGY